MITKNKIARIAGIIYLGVVILGIFNLMYVPSKLINEDNSALTLQNLTTSETLFRFGILGGLLCYILFIFLPLVLHKILKNVNENMSKLMVLLALISVPMYFINAQNEFALLSLINYPNLSKGFSTEQLQTQIFFHIRLHNQGMRLVHIFSGLWLFPFG